MRNLWQFMFGSWEGTRGETLPYTRWDVLVAVILGIAFMAAIAYSAEPQGGWSLKRGLLVGATMLFVICTTKNRRLVIGCAFSLVALRMGIGVAGPHPIVFIAGDVATGGAAWLLLHDLK